MAGGGWAGCPGAGGGGVPAWGGPGRVLEERRTLPGRGGAVGCEGGVGGLCAGRPVNTLPGGAWGAGAVLGVSVQGAL